MGQVYDCLFRQHPQNKLYELEHKVVKHEEFMEQWLVNNSCCDTPFKINKFKHIYR